MTSGDKPTRIESGNALDKSDAALIGLLSVLDDIVSRTKLMNLTYLLDYLSLRHSGSTITEFSYRIGEYGPEQAGNSIVERLEELSERGFARQVGGVESLESGVGYRVSEYGDEAALPLDSDDWALIHSVVHTYGSLVLSEILAECKRAELARSGRKYVSSRMGIDSEAAVHPALEDKEFDQMIRAALDDKSERITIEELRRQIEKSPNL